MKKKNRMLALIATIILVVGVVAYIQSRPSTSDDLKSITIAVEHLEGEDSTFKLNTDREFLREILEDEKLATGEETQYGLFVTCVDGETADDTKEQWWKISVNGEMSMNSVDTQPVADGDEYVFTLVEGYDS